MISRNCVIGGLFFTTITRKVKGLALLTHADCCVLNNLTILNILRWFMGTLSLFKAEIWPFYRLDWASRLGVAPWARSKF